MKAATTPLPPAGVEDLEAVISAYSEVTERLKQSHETLRMEVCRLREQIEQKNRELARRERLAALGEMAAGVAHEIRNPLAGIGLYASLLERDLEDRPELREIVRRIGAGVRKLDGIVNDTLAFAKGAEPVLRPERLAEIVQRVISQTAPQAGALCLEIEVDPGLDEVVVSCDARQIERALLNLVFNALDAIEERGRVWIRAGAWPGEGELFDLIIEDNGCGIDPDQLHRVFNPFFTTKASGTGLGLAIVHRIAEAHGGRVSADNRKGGGALFTMSLPRAGGTIRAQSRTDTMADQMCVSQVQAKAGGNI